MVRAELEKGCIDWFRPLLETVPSGWVAGGAVRDYFARTETDSDIDVFFKSESDFNDAIKTMKARKGFKRIYAHKTLAAFRWRGKVVQLIGTHFFPDAKATIEQFDFTVCCCAVTVDAVFHHEHFFEDLAGKRLAINSMPFPLSTLERLQKYVAKGFVACNGTLLSIAKGIQAANMEDEENTLQFYANGDPRFMRFD